MYSNKIWTQVTPFFICSVSLCVKVLDKIIATILCFMHQGIFRPNYIFNNDAFFLDFRAWKLPLIFFNLKSCNVNKPCILGVLNYEKQHKEDTCKVSGRSVVFQYVMLIFVFAPNQWLSLPEWSWQRVKRLDKVSRKKVIFIIVTPEGIDCIAYQALKGPAVI